MTNRETSILTFLAGFIVIGGAIPPVAKLENRLGVLLLKQRLATPARYLFKYLTWYGNADARNNLGVIYERGFGIRRDRKRALEYFAKAMLQDNLQARYNYVSMLPDEGTTPMKMVRLKIAALEKNIKLGDVQSNALLVKMLFYENRKGIVPNIDKRKLKALKALADTGDNDFRYMYAEALWKKAETNQDGRLLSLAVSILTKEVADGNAQAAELLGTKLYFGSSWVKEANIKKLADHDAFGWWEISANMGSVISMCLYGNNKYKWLEYKYLPWDGDDSYPRPNPNINDPEVIRQNSLGRQYLESCVSSKRIRTKQSRSPDGAAMYAYKYKGYVTGLVGATNWANLYLGIIYLNGVGVQKDVAKARSFLQVAWKKYNLRQAKKLLEKSGL